MRGTLIRSLVASVAAAVALSIATPAGAIEPEAVRPAKAAGKASAGKKISHRKSAAGRSWSPEPGVRIGATQRYRGGGPYGFLPGVRSPRAIEVEGAGRYGSGYGQGGYGWY